MFEQDIILLTCSIIRCLTKIFPPPEPCVQERDVARNVRASRKATVSDITAASRTSQVTEA